MSASCESISSLQYSSRFRKLRQLGQGGFATVWLAWDLLSGELVALKTIKIAHASLKKTQVAQLVENELQISRVLRHPHVITTSLAALIDSDTAVLVMEYADEGDLLHFLNSNERLSEQETCKLFRQILEALLYIHAAGYCHLDVKLENLLRRTDGTLLLCDFTFSRPWKPGVPLLNHSFGSPAYCAPEIFDRRPFCGPEADVWAAGVVLYALAHRALPFSGASVKLMRESAQRGPNLSGCSPLLGDLLKKMLTRNCQERCTLEQIAQHTWVLSNARASSHGIPSAPSVELRIARARLARRIGLPELLILPPVRSSAFFVP